MSRKPYTQKSYTYHTKYIKNALALRPPQCDALEIFARICDVLSLSKDLDMDKELTAVRELCPMLTDFEWAFPSICLALATGIGKTRLMGACIAYLHYEKGIRNFFVIAPSLTIYQKLRYDLGNPSNPKYVFRGLNRFITPPRIVDGDNYEEFRQGAFGASDVVVNIFNISKLNADSKVKNGMPARIKRFNEVLGESYFSYLQSLPDLCIFMDESHHYHTDKSFEVINKLHPILGVELTATPQIQRGTKKIAFRNVVYEYSLSHALQDGQFVKVPAVITRKDFHPEKYTDRPDLLDRIKLEDGLRIHEEVKSRLEVYARTCKKPMVKPFVLVVAKDTEHSRQIREYLSSDTFFQGAYKDKVLEINSTQRGTEKDENIERLLSLEKPGNQVEVVIHVNMLKEGWDVTNLYTIVPLRASISETLTEQTIGRGLRLPFGSRTGVEEIDRLSIISHDRYENIIALANSSKALVQKVYCVEDVAANPGDKRITVEMGTAYDEITKDKDYIEQLARSFVQKRPANGEADETEDRDQARQVTRFIAELASRSVWRLARRVGTFAAVSEERTRKDLERNVVDKTVREFPVLRPEEVEPVVRRAVETCVQALTDKVIPIPQAVAQSFAEVRQRFEPFKLDTSNMYWFPNGDAMLGMELREGGETFEIDPDTHTEDCIDTPEKLIVMDIIMNDDIDYEAAADLIYSLVNDAKRHFLTYLTTDEMEKVLRSRHKDIAEDIYRQLKTHFILEEPEFQAREMRPFSRIETNFGSKLLSDEIYPLDAVLPQSEVRQKVFGGFRKACHTCYKFDNDTERIFAMILEWDDMVLRWMRPAPKQFKIYYGPNGCSCYEPKFIVEITGQIYMVDLKVSRDLDCTTLEKAEAAIAYCRTASEWNAVHTGKPWTYVLIPHDEIHTNSSFDSLVRNCISENQLKF